MIYITDALRAIVNNSCGGKERIQLKLRYADIINNKPEEPTKTPEEIIGNIRAKLGKGDD